MRLKISWIGKTKEAPIQTLTTEYLKRIARYIPTEHVELKSEAPFLEAVAKEKTRPVLVLLDSRGKQLSSEEFAQFISRHQDSGTQLLWFAIGPANGFTDAAHRAAATVLSLGKMTLAHELARVVLLEQIYRAFTILKGHPYHTGH